MLQAIELAKTSGENVLPNPLVGALVVLDDEIVGRGWHKGSGSIHAEVMALSEAGKQSIGATMYVTLEPCNHFGKTPPCSAAIIKADIAEVYVASIDVNKRVHGGGVRQLQEAGIKVVVGLEEKAEKAMNASWHEMIRAER
ncbi:UNVERIFIED_CONTAM: hypothetical protein GTU68_040610 [Idotea baltica]|nr:hypothetical protein [Idotea baltica]